MWVNLGLYFGWKSAIVAGMETSSNFDRAAASKARMAQPARVQTTNYPGSKVKDALRMIGILAAVCSALVGVGFANGPMPVLGLGAFVSGLVVCALMFALAAIVENLIAIRQNTEH